MDEDFFAELMQTFLLEFHELMDLYRQALNELRRPKANHKQAIADLFRIYHTLKGDAGYFEEFQEFANFASHYCELLRPQDESILQNHELLTQLRLNYTRISGALNALDKGQTLQSFRFKIFLKNF